MVESVTSENQKHPRALPAGYLVDNQSAAGRSEFLSVDAYTDPEHFKSEFDQFFRKGWISIGTGQQLPTPKSVVTIGINGESLIATRDKSGEIHVFHNICRHRGVRVLEDNCAEKIASGLLICPYHKWSYSLDGRLVATPYWDGCKGSTAPADDKSNMGLARVRSAVWGDIIFVNLSADAEPFDEFIAPLQKRWAEFDLSLARQFCVQSYDVTSNWKFACENFVDIYHVPYIHSQLGRPDEIFSGIEVTDLGRNIFGFIMPDFNRAQDETMPIPASFPDLPERFAYALDLIYVFPNTLLMVTPNWYQVLSLFPKSAGTTQERLWGYIVGDDMKGDEWAEYRVILADILREVNEQDIEILQRLQAGRTTKAANDLHYAPAWDHLCQKLAQRVHLRPV